MSDLRERPSQNSGIQSNSGRNNRNERNEERSGTDKPMETDCNTNNKVNTVQSMIRMLKESLEKQQKLLEDFVKMIPRANPSQQEKYIGKPGTSGSQRASERQSSFEEAVNYKREEKPRAIYAGNFRDSSHRLGNKFTDRRERDRNNRCYTCGDIRHPGNLCPHPKGTFFCYVCRKLTNHKSKECPEYVSSRIGAYKHSFRNVIRGQSTQPRISRVNYTDIRERTPRNRSKETALGIKQEYKEKLSRLKSEHKKIERKKEKLINIKREQDSISNDYRAASTNKPTSSVKTEGAPKEDSITRFKLQTVSSMNIDDSLLDEVDNILLLDSTALLLTSPIVKTELSTNTKTAKNAENLKKPMPSDVKAENNSTESGSSKRIKTEFDPVLKEENLQISNVGGQKFVEQRFQRTIAMVQEIPCESADSKDIINVKPESLSNPPINIITNKNIKREKERSINIKREQDSTINGYAAESTNTPTSLVKTEKITPKEEPITSFKLQAESPIDIDDLLLDELDDIIVLDSIELLHASSRVKTEPSTNVETVRNAENLKRPMDSGVKGENDSTKPEYSKRIKTEFDPPLKEENLQISDVWEQKSTEQWFQRTVTTVQENLSESVDSEDLSNAKSESPTNPSINIVIAKSESEERFETSDYDLLQETCDLDKKEDMNGRNKF